MALLVISLSETYSQSSIFFSLHIALPTNWSDLCMLVLCASPSALEKSSPVLHLKHLSLRCHRVSRHS